MSVYTVSSGDTLSGIGQKLGLDWHSLIPQVKGGNPNMIHPGDTFNYGAPTPATPAPTATAAAPAAGGTGSPTDYLKTAGAQLDQTVSQQNSDLTGFLGKQSSDLTNFQNTTNAKYNVPGLEDAATALRNRINDLSTNAGNAASGYAGSNQTNSLLDNRYRPLYSDATNQAQTAENLSGRDITNFLNQQLTATNAYTSAQKNQLDALIAKFQTGATLTTAEWTALNDNAQKELDRLNTITAANVSGRYQVQAAGASAAGALANAAVAAWKQQADGSWVNVQTGATRPGTPITVTGGGNNTGASGNTPININDPSLWAG